MDQDLEQLQAGSNYKFSATKIDKLGASEYTLVTIACDASSSVAPFAQQLETMLKTVLNGCDKSQRREHLMLRLTQFSHSLTELHGFKLLSSISEDDYTGVLNIGGNTALFDAVDEALQVMATYGAELMKQEFLVNGIIFIITDGENNSGIAQPADIKKAVERARRSEVLESITTVLVGVTNNSTDMGIYLKTFKDDAALDQYVDIGTATPGKLAKLAAFVSQSVSSTSQALGTGSPSQPIAPKF
jgi:von Willebrand factor type A domain